MAFLTDTENYFIYFWLGPPQRRPHDDLKSEQIIEE